jgi:signal transduction histidine kinase
MLRSNGHLRADIDSLSERPATPDRSVSNSAAEPTGSAPDKRAPHATGRHRRGRASANGVNGRSPGDSAHRKADTDLRALYEVSGEMLATLDLGPLLQVILERLATVISYNAAAILIEKDGALDLQAYHRSRAAVTEPDGKWLPLLLERLDVRIGARYVRYVPDVRNRAVNDPPGSVYPPPRGVKTLLALPLTARDEPLGLLVLCHNRADRYTQDQRDLLRAFANHVAIAIVNNQLYQQAREAAILQERSRLSRDLHHSVAQSLYSINLYADAARLAMTAGNGDSARRHLTEIKGLVREAIGDTRLLLFELMPSVLEKEGLAGAILARLKAVEDRAGFSSELIVEGEDRLSPELESDIYSAAQEALTNVLKHAKASRVMVRLAFGENATSLTVEDDGAGFQANTGRPVAAMGLNSIEERVSRLGGNLQVDSAPGQGTRLTIEVPR